MSSGSLTVVGTGIRAGEQLTPEARRAIERAEDLFYVASDPVAALWLEHLHPGARTLDGLYQEGRRRLEIYEAMVDAILEPVRRGRRVCAAFYGHPGIFVYASNEAIDRARREGHDARMLPAVSAADALFADLGVDPALDGCQSYDATDFLLHGRRVDTTAGLILWQVGLIGDDTYRTEINTNGLATLADSLLERYPAAHEVTLYEASQFPVGRPHVERLLLERLPMATVSTASTLFVPPSSPARVDAAMARRLGFG